MTNLSNGNTYGYDANGNMTSRHVRDGETFKDYTLNYDAENRLVSVTGDATASFVYDGDSKQVKATVNGVTTYYVGNHYEVKSGVVTKYYFAGATRLAVRTNGTLSYLLGDHIGSSSVTTDANGAKTASALYKAFGETRYTLGNLGTDYKFTGQREEASLGIYFFNARWMDPSLGRFTSPDTIVPTETQGTQAWDRYAFVNNNPVRYNDPTGHMCREDGKGCDGSWRNPSASPGSSNSGWDDDANEKNDDPSKSCLNDLLDCYLQGWRNFGSAWTTITTPGTPAIAEVYAIVYLIGWGGAHLGLAIGLAGLGCAALGPGCAGPVESALGIGNAASYQSLVQMANGLYPKLASKAPQLHHIFPKYLGGTVNGAKILLPAAYHQLITNGFRAAWAYGQGAPTMRQAIQIMNDVYKAFPLP